MGQKIAGRNKVGMNRHFQASWASQPMGCLFVWHHADGSICRL